MTDTKTVSFSNVLKHLRDIADDNGNTKGNLFERLIKLFLQTDPMYVGRFSKVWLWNEYPERGDRGDFGVDLVAKELDGTLCAIQCKFYAKRTIVKKDIDSFLEGGSRSEFDSMILFYTSRGYGKKVEEALKGHNCKTFNFESLANSNVKWPNLANGITKEVMRNRLYCQK